MFAVLPNTDSALILFLRGHGSLTPLHAGRVGTKLESASTSIRVSGLGGANPWPWEANPEYQIECWGGTQEQAEELSRLVCAAIYDLRGPIPGGHVSSARVSLWPVWSPDPNGRPRYLCQVELVVHPEGT